MSIGSLLIDVRSNFQNVVWSRACFVTQHTIFVSCVPSTLKCEVEQNTVAVCCVFLFRGFVPCVRNTDSMGHVEDLDFSLSTSVNRMLVGHLLFSHPATK